MRDYSKLNEYLFDVEVQEQFWSLLDIEDLWGCRYWLGRPNDQGYGAFGNNKVGTTAAHRVSFYLTHGFWPNIARHTCDNRLCANPVHILDGTIQDNMDDKVARGRQARGSGNGMSRLNEKQVLEIIERVDFGETYRAVGARYGVTRQTIMNIVHGRSWKHLTTPKQPC